MFSATSPAATFAFKAIVSDQDFSKTLFGDPQESPYTLLRGGTGTMQTFDGFPQSLALAAGDPTKFTYTFGATTAANPPALTLTSFDDGLSSGKANELFTKATGDVNTLTIFLSGSPVAVGTIDTLTIVVDMNERTTGTGQLHFTAAGGNNPTFFNEIMSLTGGTGIVPFQLGTFLAAGAPTSYGPDAELFNSSGSFDELVTANHPPIGMAKSVATLEDTSYVFKVSDFGFSDPNDTPANSLLAVKIATLPLVGSLTNNGVAVTSGASITASDVTAGKLRFAPVATKNGSAYASFTFQVSDNGGTANGGIDTDVTPRKLSIAVTPVNDAPIGTQTTITTLENTAHALKLADFGFTDPNDTPANTLIAVKLTTLPTMGTLKDNGTTVTVGQFVSAADINAGKLVITPVSDLNGGPYFLCKFQVQDSGGTANGGVNLDPSPKVLDIRITHVNQTPTGTAKTLTTPVNIAYTFKVADFGLTDSHDTPSNALFAVKITTLPVLGKLTDNGVAVVAGARISVADIMANKLKFTPVKNGRGTAYATFTFQVQDNGGTANGGIDLDPTPRKMTLNVT